MSKPPVRIGFIIDRIFHIGGGTEMYLSRLVRGLNPDRFDCRIAVLRPCDWEIDRELFPCPLDVLGFGAVLRPTVFRDRTRLAAWLADNRIDIAQTLFPDAHLIGLSAARRAGIPVRVRSRRNLGLQRSAARVQLERWAGRHATHFLANSQAAAGSLVRLDSVAPSRVLVVPNGADTSRFPTRTDESVRAAKQKLGIDPDDRVITLVSNVRRIKDTPTFFAAAPQVLRDEPRACFVLLGHGDPGPWNDLQRSIDSLGIRERCVLPGRVEDVMPYLAATDVAVLTSLSEGLSNALLEYQGCGIPTVATNVGGNPEIVIDGETGYLIPIKSPDILCEKILATLADRELATRLGREASTRVRDQFSLERELRAHERLYDALAGRTTDQGHESGFRMRQATTPPLGERIVE